MTQTNSLYTEYKGALIENYCAKEMKAFMGEQLYYWKSNSQAEVDFLIEKEGHIYPIEVKSGLTQHKKSLISFQEKYNSKKIIRLSPKNFDEQGNFMNLPLYAACVLRNFI